MRIAILGKLANLDWGLESLISRHQDRAKIPMGLYDDDDLVLCMADQRISHIVSLQGRRINRKHFRSFKGKKILWNAEFLPYPGFENDPEARARLHVIEPLDDFDLILNGCPLSTQWLRDTRNLNAQWFPMIGVDPLIHRRIPEIEKYIDVGFYGTVNERRARIFQSIAAPLLAVGKSVHWANVWGEDLIRFINRCEIVLNLHYTDQLNTESRIYEVLGCGTECLSEPISAPKQFETYLLSTSKAEDMAEKILWRLNDLDSIRYANDRRREAKDYVHSRFNILTVLNMLADRCEEV